MSNPVRQSVGSQAELERLRQETQRLKAELAHTHNMYSHVANARGNLLVSARMCALTLAPDFTVHTLRNNLPILGPLPLGTPAVDIIKTPEAGAYFKGIRHLCDRLPALARSIPEEGWTLAYPTEPDKDGFAAWKSLPLGCWKAGATAAELVSEEVSESYLISPREIVGPDDDFRIEYSARSDREGPKDLSVVVGSGLLPDETDIGAFRPDRAGYCFAFGAMGNYLTELQRSGEGIGANPDFHVVPGREHRCVAERLGGVLRFRIDGEERCSAVDCLPLMGKGHGYVGLYSCAPRQVFRNLRVWTRPTCLAPETRRLMEALGSSILRVPQGPARFIEIHYLRNFFFLLKDMTEVIVQRELLEDHQRQAEKMEALLHLANAAAHEMNQPLTLLMGYVDLILQRAHEQKQIPIDQEELAALKEATDRMTAIVEKIGAIRRYKTKPYLGDREILDIEASSRLTQITQKPPVQT